VVGSLADGGRQLLELPWLDRLAGYLPVQRGPPKGSKVHRQGHDASRQVAFVEITTPATR